SAQNRMLRRRAHAFGQRHINAPRAQHPDHGRGLWCRGIATECPTCHSGLEMHQIRAEKVLGKKTNVKILYFTQLLGMALGLSARKVGVNENFSESRDLLKAKGLG
ncbi:CoB--CoM heterodisulfide reductase, partial [mine drainage metagenome]